MIHLHVLSLIRQCRLFHCTALAVASKSGLVTGCRHADCAAAANIVIKRPALGQS